MGFWSAIGNFISGVVGAISSVLSGSGLLQVLLPMLAAAIPPPLDIIAVGVITAITASMGKKEKPEELGYQMNEADKKPEDFGSFKEYRAYLDEKYPFDQEKYDQLTPEQKQACRYIGMAGVISELKESKGFELTPESLGIIAKGAGSLNWSKEQIGSFAQGLSTKLDGEGISSLADIESLAKGRLNPDKYDTVLGAIEAGAKMAGVKQSSDEIIASLQENV